MFVPLPIFGTHDRPYRANEPGTTYARTYVPEVGLDADYNHRLLIYAALDK